MKRRVSQLAVALFSAAAFVSPALAQVQPAPSVATEKIFRDPVLEVSPPIDSTALVQSPQRASELEQLGASPEGAIFDSRTGRWSSLLLARPLLPGSGVGNRLSWIAGRPPADDAGLRAAAATAVLDYLRTQSALRIDASQLTATPRAAVMSGADLIDVWIPRVVDGIRVRDNAITAIINHGNLVLLGLETWGDIDTSLQPAITAEDAQAAALAFIAPLELARWGKMPRLELVPANGSTDRISYRLVWVIESRIRDDEGRWENLVDARTGEVLAFEDLNQYARRRVVGGVYPVSNDGVAPDGAELAGWPMPWADVSDGVTVSYTDAGGNAGCIPGSISTALSGLFVRIADNCGAVNESSASNSLDLGTSAGTNCTVPASHSAGDTHSARSGFFELNRIKETARGHLPTNVWLQQRLTAIMNINQNCNAFWDFTAVNFFRQGSGCGNTGEIAAVFDHEWGHGLDNNGVDPSISSPGEAIADIYAALRLNTSCIGRGLTPGVNCTGYGDSCTTCTGIRDIDFAQHASGNPHNLDWINALCPAQGSRGPCNRETHCEGMVAAEVAWDLMKRDLTGAPFNFDASTARETTARLFYLGAQLVTSWYACTIGTAGCGATAGYLNILAADDDNGNLSDGTPHMTAIFAAFNRHQIACATPTVVNGGCAGGPTAAPSVTVTPIDRGAVLTWAPVANATKYAVYRTDGVFACNFGMIKVGETASPFFTDGELQNGRSYSYNVAAVGATDACFGPMSSCDNVTPVAGPSLDLASGPVVSGGDGDPFLDNCETATATFVIRNDGTGNQHNVRITAVDPLTHPSTLVLTPLPLAVAATLDECDTSIVALNLQAGGLSFDETSEVRVTLASDEVAERQVTLRFEHVESDLAPFGDKTFGFETDMEGWKAVVGTFVRSTSGGGAGGSVGFLRSTQFIDSSCDVVRSPLFRLNASGSTLAIQDRYIIEPTSGGVPFDRANVSIFDTSTGKSKVVNPDGGNLYNVAAGALGPCVTDGEAGWNGNNPSNATFDASTWSSTPLNAAGAGDHLVQIEVAYAADGLTSLAGFQFDQVKLTNVQMQVPDAQPDVCGSGTVGPFGLQVDPSGNGVLDVGETVSVEPAWQNFGLADISLTGTASGFTGPAGATYTLTDASGAYGTIGSSSSAFCFDCYAVSVAAASRPLPHWDATLLETPSAGSPKTWTLHVGNSFPDVTGGNFYPFIENVLHNGVTAGCGGGLYCPTANVTRQQMAVFLLKAKEGAAYLPPSCVTPAFPDVPCSSSFAPWVNELVTRGITAGCGGGNYCPTAATNRQQMAVFLLKTEEGSGFNPPACTTPMFDDVPCSNTFSKWINELVTRGVTAGCGGPNYCPVNPVLRQQMAVFLVRTFGLQLYGL